MFLRPPVLPTRVFLLQPREQRGWKTGHRAGEEERKGHFAYDEPSAEYSLFDPVFLLRLLQHFFLQAFRLPGKVCRLFAIKYQKVNSYYKLDSTVSELSFSAAPSFVRSKISVSTIRRSRPYLRRESCFNASASSRLPCLGGYMDILKGRLAVLSMRSFV